MDGQMSICRQVLTWNRRLHAVHGQPHDHVCKLAADHPVSEGSALQVHHCGTCTTAWESTPAGANLPVQRQYQRELPDPR
jgi:hypothetical protein